MELARARHGATRRIQRAGAIGLAALLAAGLAGAHSDPSQSYSADFSLRVRWARAVFPGASILVVLAPFPCW